jgi:hypothetical protein
MKRSWTLVLAAVLGCFDASAPVRLYGCNEDRTCPARFVCDQAIDRPAVCCLPGVLRCPTLREPDNTCADGSSGATFLRDFDDDGFGNPNEQVIRCAQPVGYVARTDRPDCDDTAKLVNPDTVEACNGIDDNCDRQIDEGLSPRELFLRDEDADGYPQADAGAVLACAAPPGTVRAAGAQLDCAPFQNARNPGAPELCNGVDDDCDDSIVAASYADTQLPDASVRFPCLVPNGQGICRDGVWTCSAGVRPVCTALRGPTRETCDGIDTDCDGVIDNHPGCGGPTSLLGQPGLTYGGGMVPGGSELFDRCQKGRISGPGVNSAGRLTGTRNGDVSLVWWVEAPAGQTWDLSAKDLRLNLAWDATGTMPVTGRGLWGLAGAGPGLDGVHPVVYLCGEASNDLIRYRWAQAASSFKMNDTSFRGQLHLDPNQPDGGFLLGLGSGFDTRRVKRIEVMVRFLGATYDFNVLPSTGFQK